jgi:hypothetical protein
MPNTKAPESTKEKLRFAEYVGRGIPQHAAARAVGVSPRTAERGSTPPLRGEIQEWRDKLLHPTSAKIVSAKASPLTDGNRKAPERLVKQMPMIRRHLHV